MKNRNKVHFGITDHAASRRKHVNEFLDIVNEDHLHNCAGGLK